MEQITKSAELRKVSYSVGAVAAGQAASAYMELGQWPKAEELLKRCLSLHSESAKSQRAKQDELERLPDYDPYEHLFSIISQNDCRLIKTEAGIGSQPLRVTARQVYDDLVRAEDEFLGKIAEDPWAVITLSIGKGRAALALDELKDAERSFYKAVEWADHFKDVWGIIASRYRLCLLHVALGEYWDARREWFKGVVSALSYMQVQSIADYAGAWFAVFVPFAGKAIFRFLLKLRWKFTLLYCAGIFCIQFALDWYSWLMRKIRRLPAILPCSSPP